jgi:hypothetical protein
VIAGSQIGAYRRPDIVMRFFNEARAATSIAAPGIVQIFDFGHHSDGSAYLVMELLEGRGSFMDALVAQAWSRARYGFHFDGRSPHSPVAR